MTPDVGTQRGLKALYKGTPSQTLPQVNKI